MGRYELNARFFTLAYYMNKKIQKSVFDWIQMLDHVNPSSLIIDKNGFVYNDDDEPTVETVQIVLKLSVADEDYRSKDRLIIVGISKHSPIGEDEVVEEFDYLIRGVGVSSQMEKIRFTSITINRHPENGVVTGRTDNNLKQLFIDTVNL